MLLQTPAQIEECLSNSLKATLELPSYLFKLPEFPSYLVRVAREKRISYKSGHQIMLA